MKKKPAITEAELKSNEASATENNKAKPAPPVDSPKVELPDNIIEPDKPNGTTENPPKAGVGDRYSVSSKAYFYTKADEGSRTNKFIIAGSSLVKALDDKGDFILVRFKDDQGDITEGWIRKSDLTKL